MRRIASALISVMLLTHRLEPPLDACIETLWYYEGSQPMYQRERVLPNGRFQLVIDLSSGRGAVDGVGSQYIEIDPGAIGPSWSRLPPGGARAFLKQPAGEFYNKVVPLDSTPGNLGRFNRRNAIL